ncbi:MAG: pyridoxal-phosphate dependent enzyme [Planctomycetota bacterium]|nr:pyridoxal-phosphate dependent enzyme [Planctomycetota bacterium]
MNLQQPVWTSFCTNLPQIQAASQRIAPLVIETPTITFESLSRELGCSMALKCENFQHGFAFKAPGACNAVFRLTDQEASRGVVAHSSGNHAAALARAANLRKIKAHIVMPENSAKIKLAAVRGLGVEPVMCDSTPAAREAMADHVMRTTGATMVHPFNDARVIAGQGTVGLEILRQYPDVETIVVPVGGGGLLSGLLIAVKSLKPSVRVIAAEPQWADDAFRSMISGQIEPVLRTDSIADGLRTPLGSLTFPIIHQLVDEILCASESSIAEAMQLISSHAKMIVEASGSVPLAVVHQHRSQFADQRVVCVVSGGNRDD